MQERPRPFDIAVTSTVDWLVIGWFTPDYRHLAERLARQLRALGTPHHFYAVPAADGTLRQITRQKPQILLRAMGEHPGKTLVLVDVDSHVLGDISTLLPIRADVAHWMKSRAENQYRSQRGRLRFHVADRVLVFAPTAEARRFAEMWLEDCGREDIPPKGGSEWARSHTVGRAYGVTFQALPLRYAGLEIGKAGADAVIVHESETGHRRMPLWKRLGSFRFSCKHTLHF